MFKRFLMIPLFMLWISIVLLRLLLAPETLGHFLIRPWPDILFFVFIASITATEIAILLRARSAYEGLPEATASAHDHLSASGGPRGTRTKKFMIFLFLCCAPLALWDSRNASIGIAIPGLLVGGAFNFLFVATLSNAVFGAKSRIKLA